MPLMCSLCVPLECTLCFCVRNRIGGYDVKDRQEAARFQVIDCDMYSSSEYVNEVLRPLKRPESAGV
jgi:hypothetical protein